MIKISIGAVLLMVLSGIAYACLPFIEAAEATTTPYPAPYPPIHRPTITMDSANAVFGTYWGPPDLVGYQLLYCDLTNKEEYFDPIPSENGITIDNTFDRFIRGIWTYKEHPVLGHTVSAKRGALCPKMFLPIINGPDR